MFRSLGRPGASRSARALGFVLVSALLAATVKARPPQTVFDSPNPGGVSRTIALGDNTLDESNPFFQSLGANGRSCVSCHVPSTGWTITPAELRERFDRTQGLDPVFRPVDGANSPGADVSSVDTRRAAYSMLLKKGVIRVGIPIPPGAEFDLVAVDDPYGHASRADLSLFRRPLPSTNLRFLTAVMWDGRESSTQTSTTPIDAAATPDVNNMALFKNLRHQADGATRGHAEGIDDLTDAQQDAIALFELNLATAQRNSKGAGTLTARGAKGGPEYLALEPFYVTINDVLGADTHAVGQFKAESMDLFGAWANSNNPHQAAVARGAAVFGSKKFNITGVGGLNDDLGAPVIAGTCTTCHDSPNVGNHSVALAIDIGVTDASRRTPDMPLYTLRNRVTREERQTTDPGRALITGKWKDVGKFKGPVLRALASRPPYFHDGSAASLEDAVDFYDTRFDIGLTDQEKSDLVAFLGAL